MNIKPLNHNTKKCYSSKNKSFMVEEIRSGMLSIKQSMRQYQIAGSVLQRWNRWYFKTKLLKYVSPIDAFDMNPSEDPQQLRQQLKVVQAELEQLKLKNLALETLISVAEKELKIDIRKKPGSKLSKS